MGETARALFARLVLIAGLAVCGPAQLRAEGGYETETKQACVPDRTSFRLSSNTPFMWKGIAVAIADWRIQKTSKTKKGKGIATLVRVGIFPVPVKEGLIHLSSNVPGLKGKFEILSGVIYPVDDMYCADRRVGLLCSQMTMYETEQTLSMQCQLYVVGADNVFDP